MKAYWIAIYKDLKNLENIKKYAEKASTAIKKHNGKKIAKFLSESFWTEHSLSGDQSPEIDWSRASAHINHFMFEGIVYNVNDGDKIEF